MGKFLTPRKILKDGLFNDKSSNILEIGCGNGEFLVHLHNNYPDSIIWGLDISNFALRKALSRIKGVEESYYRVEHPLKNSIVIYVRTDGSIGPREAVETALKNTKDIVEQLYQLVKKGLEIEERG